MSDLRMPAPPEAPDAAALLDGGRPALAEAKEEVLREHAPVEPEPEPVPPVAVAPSPAEPVPASSAPPATSQPAAPVDERLAKLAEAWDVQVAAGSSAEGAERLRSTLVAAGYKARVRRDAGIFRVVVGPVLRRDDAVALRTALAADARVGRPAGLLVRYIP
ncbi:MAG: SPOR domain-containing protein, partial [Gammaproteobacteria bacterium]